MTQEELVQEVTELYTRLTNCCLGRNPPFDPGDITDVICWRWRGASNEGWQDGPKHDTESNSYIVVRLSGERFGVIEESEDYTGHGCQCSSNASVFDNMADLIKLGLDIDQRKDFTREPGPGFVAKE